MPVAALGDRLGRLARRPRRGAARSGSVDGSRRFRFLRPSSNVAIYIGLALIVAGFVAIGITWGKVARELQVALQLPYLASGGLTGLGLIIVGATVVNISVKRRDAAARNLRLERLATILEELRSPSNEDEE